MAVRLLGEVAVTKDGALQPAFASLRLQALVGYLVMHRDAPQHRGHVAMVLWPDSSDAQCRTNLRHLLHRLRHALPHFEDHVEVTASHLRWKADGPADVDLIRFDLAAAHGLTGSGPDAEAALAEAAAAYTGALLPAHYDDWVIEAREELQRRAAEVLARLADSRRERGDAAGEIDALRDRLVLHPGDEATYRRIMVRHLERGDRVRALRTYQACVRALTAELGVPPSPETMAVRTAILGTSAPAAEDPQPVAPASIVGRDLELAQCHEVWKQATAGSDGQPTLLLVGGEAGIGKSRVVAELLDAARRTRALVASSRAYEVGGALAYGPVTDWLRTPPFVERISRLADHVRRDLGPILPEVEGDAGVDMPAPDDIRRRRMYEAMAEVLLDTERPVLLALDDLQWCDADSLSFVLFLLRRAQERAARLLVAATARLDELREGGAARSLLQQLTAAGLALELTLSRLGPDDTARLASASAGRPLTDAEAERLVRTTDGNPLFVVEAVRAGLDREASTVTPTVKAVIHGRLNQLSEPARRMAELAAAVGTAFTTELLHEASGMGIDDSVASLDELWRAGLIREHDAATGPGSEHDAYDFSHDKLREVAYESISPVRRRRLHQAVAEAMLSTAGPTGSGAIAGRLASQYELAGRPAEAVRWLVSAAAHASSVYANDDAIAALSRAITTLDRLPPSAERDRSELELRVAIGAPLAVREGYGSRAPADHYQRAMALCLRLGEPVPAPVHRGVGLAMVTTCRFAEAEDHARALVAMGDDVAVVEGRYLLGVTAFWRGRFGDAITDLEAASRHFDERNRAVHLRLYGQDPDIVCRSRLAFTHWFQGDAAMAAAVMADATRDALLLGHPQTVGYVLCYAGMLGVAEGDPQQVQDALAEAEEVWVSQLGFFAPMAAALRGWLRAQDDPTDDALLRDAVTRYEAEERSLHRAWANLLLAEALVRAGRLADAAARVEATLAWTAETGQVYLDDQMRALAERTR